MKLLSYIGGLFFILFIASCGGGGGGSSGSTGTGSGLEIAEQMALVSADESAFSALMKGAFKNAAPSSGEYLTDTADIYVYDESMEVLDLVNEILCMVDQTQYAAMVNLGDYTALIDKSLCSRNDDRSGDSSNDSSGEAQEFEAWTINSSRANDSSDQIVQFWLEGGGEDGFEEIRAQITITEGKSEANPFGLFSMDIVGYASGFEVMTGNLSSVENADGHTEFEMFIDGGESMQEATHAIIRSDETGEAYALRTFFMGDMGSGDSGMEELRKQGAGGEEGGDFGGGSIETHEINVAYNSDHYYTDFGDKTSCKERNPNNNVWEYNLYDEAGARVSRDSGFGIKYGDSDRGWGYAGYYGVWLPEDLVTVESGLEVTRADDGTPYTVFQGEGRLIRRVKNTLTLEDFVGDTFQYWFSTEKQFSTAAELADAINLMNGWRVIATAAGNTITLTSTEMGTFSNTIALAKNSSAGLTLSGSTLSGGTATKAASGTITFGSPSNMDTVTIDNITYFKVDEVAPKSFVLEWDGTNFNNIGEEICEMGEPCRTEEAAEASIMSFGPYSWIGLWKQGLGQVDLVASATGEISNTDEMPYYSEEFVPPSDALFASGAVALKCYSSCLAPNLTEGDISSDNVYLTDSENVDDPHLYSFDPEAYVLTYDGDPVIWPEDAGEIEGNYSWGIRSNAMVEADVDVAEVWNIWQEDISYNWETGPNEWNRYTSLIDADGNVPEFEPPLYCQYRDETYGMYFLDYQGEGKLFGIPYDEVESEDEEWSHWVARFTIPDGSELECDGALYYTRAMSIEQTFPEVDASECAGLSTDIGAPTNEFTDHGMDSAPSVTDAPKVIAGVLQ